MLYILILNLLFALEELDLLKDSIEDPALVKVDHSLPQTVRITCKVALVVTYINVVGPRLLKCQDS